MNAYWTSSVPGIIINQSGSIPYNPTVDASTLPSFFTNSQHPVYFYWNATNGPGCSAVDSVLVTFYEIPQANAGIDTAICGLTYHNTGIFSLDNPDGIWSNLTPSIGSATFVPSDIPNSVVSVSSFGVYQFLWKEMNAGNSACYSIDTLTVNFKVTPMPDAGLDTAVCGKFVHLHAHPTVSGGQWSGETGIAFYVTPSDPAPTPSEAYNPNAWVRWPSQNDTVTLYWTEFNGTCYGYDSVNVYFGAVIEATIQTAASDSLVCGPSYDLLSAVTPSYGYGYWIDTVSNTVFSPSPDSIYSNLTATIDTGGVSYYGSHHFYFITVNGSCRDTSDAHYVRYIENPVAYAGGEYWPGLFGANRHIKTDTVCGLNYEMKAIPTVGTGTWYSLDITYVYFTQGFNGFTQTHVANDSLYLTCQSCYTVFSTATPYREFIWQEQHDICTDADTLRLYFAPRPTGAFTTTIPACRHDSSMIVAATGPAYDLNNSLVNFNWNYPGGILSPSITDPTTSSTIYVSWPTGDIHNVSLITTNRWSCQSGIVTGQVQEPPSFDPNDTVVAATCGNCNGEITLYTNYGTSTNYYTFNWLDSVITTTSYHQDSLCPGYYNVRVNGQSLSPNASPGTVCHDTIRVWLPDTGYVTANFDTLSILQMQAAPYTISLLNLTDNGKKYSWRVYDEQGTLIYTGTQPNLDYTFEDDGCYRIVLVATSKQGCRDTMDYKWLCVDAKPVLEIPNVFTPNGDGQNDDFLIHGEAIVEFKCTIFNRWGKKMYEWDDVNKGWNGKIDGTGADASPGVYYYNITGKDKKENTYDEKGFFYLLREKK